MDIIDAGSSTALVAAAALLLTLYFVRRRGRHGAARGLRDALDTVQDWPPEAARVMTVQERQAYELLRRALPGYMVLAQVPLSRFLRVPTRHSYSEWLQRVGSLSADLAVCDTGSRVLAVIDVRATDETERSRRRHDRLARVLRAAGIRVHVWREGHLPSPAEVRTALAHDLVRGSGPMQPVAVTSRPMPLIPVPEMQELDAMLAEGDAAAMREGELEPVPSGFFDDLEGAGAGSGRR
ncbi:MAG: DUF2726 domain-containing protein [Proteobacteria bacterium]|nr:DUF2726 domain-containing protein [Pseudomonadota bacterium]